MSKGPCPVTLKSCREVRSWRSVSQCQAFVLRLLLHIQTVFVPDLGAVADINEVFGGVEFILYTI